MRSYHALGTVELKVPRIYLYLLTRTTFYEGVKFVFIFTKRLFCVDRDGLNHVPMEGLGLKPLRIHSESAKYVQM